MDHRKSLTVLALLLAVCTAGCSFMPFEDPDEQRDRALLAAAAPVSNAEVDPADLLDDELSVTETLTGNQGQTLAYYSARLPQFLVEERLKGQSFQRINEYYQEQLSGYEEDCASFFTMVKGHYGEAWADAPADELLFSTEMTYALTAAPEDYVCVLRTYTMRDGAAGTEVYRNAEVFLLDSGWRLSLEELFGSHYEEAAPLLLEGIRAWCLENGMQEERAAALELSEFAPGFGMDGASLLFFLQPFTITAADDQLRTVRLPLSDYADLLPENILTPDEELPASDAPEGAA